jgi:hypothetical protein
MSSRCEPGNLTWQDLYKAAIIETDQAKLAERIAQAEWAIIVRGHSLFNRPESGAQERQALDAALDALRVLKDYSRGTTAA